MKMNMRFKPESYWFVGATWEGNDDQTPRFLSEGIWENGYDDRYLDLVRSMRPGDRIAIKSRYTRGNDLPFDNRGLRVSVMVIKAIGTITENRNDGKRVRVDWEEQSRQREWYFKTYGLTVHRIQEGTSWETDDLLAFTFGGKPQDIDRLRNAPYWRERFGDDPRYRRERFGDDPDNGAADEDEEGHVDGEQNDESPNQHIAISLPEFHEISEHIKKAGHFPLDLCRQLHLGLWANERRHFAILTGISGSGKTLLACKYGEVLTGGKAPYFCVIPVQPGWTDPSFLLGYPNPLKRDSYERTRFLELLLNTRDDNPAMPHVAILDEMNLSHPEQYLAPVLSAMETGNELELHGREGDFDGVPRSIPYPKNLVLIGTVNMDETTMGLSDKVLDRAFTLEFWDINVDDWPGWDSQELPEAHANQVKDVLRELTDALKPARLHFGYRVIDAVVAFLKQREIQTPEWDFAEMLDSVIYTKVLPKLRGDDSTRVQEAFTKCIEVLETHNLGKCLRKVREMQADLESTGSARFWR